MFIFCIIFYKDFCLGKVSTSFGEFSPNTKGNYNFSNLCDVLPEFVVSSLKEGIEVFSKNIKGYNRDDAILLGVETRTSSPVVIERDLLGEAIHGLYPCGEGAGYAGGIVSAALDGIMCATKLKENYL